MAFSQEQMERHSRHILLPEVGGKGVQRLLDASVLVVGAGGIGSPALLYLAAAGIGRIGVVDSDRVDLSNLQRQIVHATPDIGRPKAESADERLTAINPDIEVIPIAERLTRDNILGLISDYDAVVDGSDNFPTRYLVNDACQMTKTSLFTAAVLRFEGQLSVFKMQGEGPCYRCLFPAPPPVGLIPTCQEAGVLGPLVGTLGTILATEVIKHFTGVGKSLEGTLLLVDALTASFRQIHVKRSPDCPLCGVNPTITELVEWEHTCDSQER